MTYNQALKYLRELELHGINLGLGRVRKVLKSLDNPEFKLPVIHIAGTNGKGSVACFIASILQQEGYRVGLYTSPHLMDIRERIQIDGKQISRKDFTRLVQRIELIHRQVQASLTYFEFLTVMAFLYFAERKVNFAVLETGMGGRLDATNVISHPLVSVITNIDYEHQQWLGRSLQEIAREKAGIIKRGSIVITGEKRKPLLDIFRGVCFKKKAKIFRVGKQIQVLSTCPGRSRPAYAPASAGRQVFNYRGLFSNFDNLRIRFRGRHQVENAALALGAIEGMQFYNRKVSEEAIREGLASAFWPGRLERRQIRLNGRQSVVILDGAHNPAGMRCLKEYLQENGLKDIILILGFLKDKPINQMLKIILPVARKTILTRAPSLRGAPVKYIDQKARRYSAQVSTSQSLGEAIQIARQSSGKDSVICVTGSLYTVGAAMKALRNYEL